MVVGNGQAYALVDAETAVLGGHHDGRRLPRVVVGEEQLAHVVAALVRLVGQAEDDEVPHEDVVLLRRRDEVVRQLGVAALLDLLLVLQCKCLELLLESHRASF